MGGKLIEPEKLETGTPRGGYELKKCTQSKGRGEPKK